jgi:DNA (cytosine-5)-methyltransferase 1
VGGTSPSTATGAVKSYATRCTLRCQTALRRESGGLPSPRVVDLFAGAGFLSLAFKLEGFDLRLAVESDAAAATTYARNLGPEVVVADSRRIDPRRAKACDVIIAGPPCQGFSTLGRRCPQDPRNYLSLEVVRWASVLRPEAVVIENVASFAHSFVWERLASELSHLGFGVRAYQLQAADHGVPQYRSRSFTIALRGAEPPSFLALPHSRRSVRSAWRGLSPTPSGRNWHVAPLPSPIALARMRRIPVGGDKRDVLRAAPYLAPPSWHRIGCQATDVWGRMHWDEPANTIRTDFQNASKGRYIHPEQHRVISVREAARLQTIPDDWDFTGFASYAARQIGNAVPVALGRQVARAVSAML